MTTKIPPNTVYPAVFLFLSAAVYLDFEQHIRAALPLPRTLCPHETTELHKRDYLRAINWILLALKTQ